MSDERRHVTATETDFFQALVQLCPAASRPCPAAQLPGISQLTAFTAAWNGPLLANSRDRRLHVPHAFGAVRSLR
jgi:hypothetical protein